MPRVDVWDIKHTNDAEVTLGLPRTLGDKYMFGKELGRGGFGVVRVVTDRDSGEQLACKTIPKKLAVPNLSAGKQAQHLEKIKRELEVMRRLRGSLNVAQFKGAYEDETDVHLLMEWCKGGELWHRIGRAHYSEKTCASFMRAVLRTVAQAHSHRILHRDIKPGNFMLLSDSPTAPLKAIDFGLAVFFDPDQLPRTDLGLEGTPWYMAPEVLECEVGPPADVWAAGVMAYQLLSGYLPFDDRANPRAPAVSRIWQAIFAQDPKMTGGAWVDISAEAKDFVAQLLVKDPNKRPTAREALKHPWLRGSSADRATGKPLDQTVVQRIQRIQRQLHEQTDPRHHSIFEALAGEARLHRFQQGNVLKKTIFELIAGELLKAAAVPDSPTDRSVHAGSGHGMRFFREALSKQMSSEDSSHGGGHSSGSPPSAPSALGSPGMPRPRSSPGFGDSGLDTLPESGGAAGSGPASSPGGSSSTASAANQERADRYQRLFEEAQAAIGKTAGGSAHGGMEFYQPIEGYPGATTSLSRHTATGTDAAAQLAGHKRPASVHGGRAYFGGPALGPLAGSSRFRVMRAAAAAGRLSDDGSGRWAEPDYVHVAPRSEGERREQRKAARLSLDVAFLRGARGSKSTPDLQRAPSGDASGHESGSMDVDLTEFPEQPRQQRRKSSGSDSGTPGADDGSTGGGSSSMAPTALQKSEKLQKQRSVSDPGQQAKQPSPMPQASGPMDVEVEGRGRRGNAGLYKAYLESSSAEFRDPDAASSGSSFRAAEAAPQKMDVDSPQQQPAQQSQPLPKAPQQQRPKVEAKPSSPPAEGSAHGERHVRFTEDDEPSHRSTRSMSSNEDSFHRRELESAFPGTPFPQEIRDVMRRLNFSKEEEGVAAERLAEGLNRLGYRLEPSEAARLLEQMDRGGVVGKDGFLASQIDWDAFQMDFREQWLNAAQRAFEGIERKGGDGSKPAGKVRAAHLVDLLRARLPAAEVDYAVEDALLEAGAADADEIDFDGFLRLLRVSSVDALDQYDSRHAMSASHHGGSHFGDLSTVAE